MFVSNSQVIGCEDRFRNDLYCVGWGVQHCSIQYPILDLVYNRILCVIGPPRDIAAAGARAHRRPRTLGIILPPGPPGPTGATGSTGRKGGTGYTGFPGPRGPRGPPGAPGRLGFNYTGSPALAGLPGPAGYTGYRGRQGVRGVRGNMFHSILFQ